MPKIEWTDNLNTGIAVIDRQHRRIVEYLNQIDDAITDGSADRESIGQILDQMVDYTLSHFAFEESMMEEADYPLVRAHRKVHQLFTRRIGEYQTRFRLGDEVADELRSLLQTWLLNHISHDDADYAPVVKADLEKGGHAKESGWLGRTLSRFFG